MATQEQVKAFIERVAPIAQSKAKGRGKWSLPSVCIAQCCWESGYGTSPKMVKANAILGIKVGKSKVHFGNHWHDKAYSTKTKECYDGKTYVEITDMFRAYDSIDDSIGDYYDMLSSCSRYKACLNESDPLKCITAIKNGGYATGLDYANNIMSLIKKYNLTQYDVVVTGGKVTELHPVLKYGSRGQDVEEMQTNLNAAGYTLVVDGKFGPATLEAVKAYQAEHGLVVDGKVGPKTWEELNRG